MDTLVKLAKDLAGVAGSKGWFFLTMQVVENGRQKPYIQGTYKLFATKDGSDYDELRFKVEHKGKYRLTVNYYLKDVKVSKIATDKWYKDAGSVIDELINNIGELQRRNSNEQYYSKGVLKLIKKGYIPYEGMLVKTYYKTERLRYVASMTIVNETNQYELELSSFVKKDGNTKGEDLYECESSTTYRINHITDKVDDDIQRMVETNILFDGLLITNE